MEPNESQAEELRRTGIDAIGGLAWGIHFCHFYETSQDLLDILVPFFKTGLEDREYCIWIVSEPLTVAEAKRALARAVPELERHLAERSLEILTREEWYVRGGSFDLPRVVESAQQKLKEALARGYAGLRGSGDGSRAKEENWKNIFEYEKKLDELIVGQKMVLLCTYPLPQTRATEILDVVQIHQLAVAKRQGRWEVVETPELKQAKAEIQRLHEQRTAELEARVKEAEAFAYSVSHDLRLPLRGIDGFARILLARQGSRLDDQGKNLLNSLCHEVGRMDQLINNLLAFSRLSRQELRASDVDMTSLAKTTFEDLTRQTGSAARLEMKPLPSAHGDRPMLRQVFFNLLANAIKFSSREAEPAIEIGGWHADRQNTYYIKDNGVGFDSSLAHQLFGAFQRLAHDQQFEGSGVGLALVKRIIDRHRGRVWAEGRPGEGATFYFALPA